MQNENLNTAIIDLLHAIGGITLGSVEYVVKDAAVTALIQSWNDHCNEDDKIDETVELGGGLGIRIPSDTLAIAKNKK